ncbi:MAG: aminotransferase class V-fold PLP-dependent enzyme [Clostridia bacterium]
MDIYDELGVKKIINGWGTVTKVSGSLMDDRVLAAMIDASKHYVLVEELHKKAGERIAELLGVEAACVTAGAAAGIAISAAAAMTRGNKARALQLPDTAGMRDEVIILKCHRTLYDQALPMTGIKVKEVGTTSFADIEQIEQAINDKTAMFFFAAEAESMRGSVDVREIIELMHLHALPVIVDAAAEIPPTENIKKYLELGADMVIFSGGKEIRGPQSSGLILGKKQWIAACDANCCPQYSIGRPMKIDKETIVGLVKAVEIFVSKDYDLQLKKWEKLSEKIFELLKNHEQAEVSMGYPTEPGIQPTNILRVYIKPLRRTAKRVYEDLIRLSTPVYTHLDKDRLVINPQCLNEAEIEYMCKEIINSL